MSIRPPLEGVRILAISQFGAGPFGTTVLADIGPAAIKIQDPGPAADRCGGSTAPLAANSRRRRPSQGPAARPDAVHTARHFH